MSPGVVDKVVIGFIPQLLRAAVMLPLGVLLFALSFLVLWTTEGLPRFGEIAETSVAVDADATRGHDGQLVSVSGPIATTQSLGDDVFFAPGPFVYVYRVHEQYAWQEHAEVHEEKRWGGRRERTTTYTYAPAWTGMPTPTEHFRDPVGHHNPPPRMHMAHIVAPELKVGAWTVPLDQVELPGLSRLWLSEVTLQNEGARATTYGQSLYLDGADPLAPGIGDERVSFYVVRAGDPVTVFGKAQAGRIEPFSTGRGSPPMLHIRSGDREAAIEGLHLEDRFRTIALRLVGFLMMWGGLFLIPSLAYAVLDIVPLAGTVARISMALGTLVVSAALATLTIGVAIVGHNTLWTAGVLAFMVGVIVVLYYVTPLFRRDDRRSADSAA